MTCRELVEFLMSYMDEELAADQREVFEAHLTVCPPCKDYLETYRDTIRIGRVACREEDDAVPEDVPEALVRAILAARSRA